MDTGVLISLSIYFALMLGIGLYAWRASTGDVSGYMLGGRRIGPAVTALSAGASDMSGWIMLGLPGAAFAQGLSAGWIAVGLFFGAFANYLVVAPRLRLHTEMADDAITIPDFLEKRFGDRSHALRLLSAAVIVVFFTLYTSAGLVAGGKMFDSAFDVPYAWGLWITAGAVLAYVVFGGFLAVSLTDFVQGSIMFLALIVVPVAALDGSGGPSAVEAALAAKDPAMLDLFRDASVLGMISLLAWGLGYFGQPHIIVRFMAIRSVRDVPTATAIGMGWMAVTLIGAMAVGLTGAAWTAVHGLDVSDPETIFILLSEVLFDPLVTGFLYAAILAAIMSTISSQLLVASSSLVEDAYALLLRRDAGQTERVLVGRLAVVAVALAALGLAWNPESNVLGLVANAWAGFGAAFGPLILLALTWRRMTRNGALAGMLVGAATVLVWIYAPVGPDSSPLSSMVYEIVPGFLLSALAIVVVSLLDRAPPAAVTGVFDTVRARLAQPAARAR
ncbi:MAG: sodium/proline symporter PutP [Brevundimonas sp.]|jgi:sodium/proline symporter|uniref:sodium/proline symporter PutP n=1 Tax=Brevundimonas sp. TaxID=1871086 RepID=UPI0022C9514D|nr:sodium/proline symporter PutP [Brevundimonas sp.]